MGPNTPNMPQPDEIKAGTMPATQTVPQTEWQIELPVESQTEPQTIPQTAPQIVPQTELHAELRAELQTDPRTDLQTTLKNVPRTEPQIELPAETETKPRSDPQTDPQNASHIKPQTEPQVELETQLPTELPTGLQVPLFSPFPSDLEIGTDSSDQSNRDDDSALGLSLMNSTTSLRSSIYDYIEENGRTYHAYNSGKYMLPNDEQEQDRLDLQHHTFKIILEGKLHLAPLLNPQRVLDLATGTGLWAIEFAQEYEGATVIGTDLSPIQPVYVPPNCHFEVDDAEYPWVFSEPFDYIHARAIVTCFRDNRAMVQKIHDNLTPGGYFELQDPCFPLCSDDGTLNGTALEEWNQLLISSMVRVGRNLEDSQNWGRYMREAGFEDVVEQRAYVPVNAWARGRKNKLLGAVCLQNLSEGIASMGTAAFTRVLGWSQERLEVFLASVRTDLKNRQIHAYVVVYFAYGRKAAQP